MYSHLEPLDFPYRELPKCAPPSPEAEKVRSLCEALIKDVGDLDADHQGSRLRGLFYACLENLSEIIDYRLDEPQQTPWEYPLSVITEEPKDDDEWVFDPGIPEPTYKVAKVNREELRSALVGALFQALKA